MSTKCVLRNKAFILKAKDLNISEGTLEQIVFQYINNPSLIEEGYTEFPSDEYLNRKLFGTNEYSNKEDFDLATELWANQFSVPSYLTFKEALQTKEYALKYFNEDAIHVIETFNGKYMTVVTQPTIKTSTLNTYYQKNFQEELELLQGMKYPIKQFTRKTNKISGFIQRAGVSKEFADAIQEAVQQDSSLMSKTPYEIFIERANNEEENIAEEYNEKIKKPAIKELDRFLMDFLSQYGFEVVEGDLLSRFGEDITGAVDVLNKVIYLSNKEDRNAITAPEEFAHAFVELLGGVHNKRDPQTFKDYNFLYEHVQDTTIYKQVYDEYKDIYTENGVIQEDKIRKEAIGQALANALVNKYNEKDESFIDKVKKWFNKILSYFTGSEYFNINTLLDKIATEILEGKTDRLDKLDNSQFKLLKYKETIDNQNVLDNGKAISMMQYLTELGGAITGSFAYRQQGTVYRKDSDSLHDIDLHVPLDAHGLPFNSKVVSSTLRRLSKKRDHKDMINYIVNNSPFFKKLTSKYPNMRFFTAYPNGNGNFTISGVESEDISLVNKFVNIPGSYAEKLSHFTQEEVDKMYIFDFFLLSENLKEGDSFMDEEHNIRLSDFKTAFKEKLAFGRSKDVFDYQQWRAYEATRKYILSDFTLKDSINKDSVQKTIDIAIERNNGKPLHLTKEGKPSILFDNLLKIYNGDWLKATEAKAKVYSDNFINWFGDWLNNKGSKVIDENGEPKVVYHGSVIPYISEFKSTSERVFRDILNDSEAITEEDRIIWGHPALGKTTYLKQNPGIFLEWDEEVNPLRNEFIRNKIDPNHTMNTKSDKYQRLKREYLSNWSNPEYKAFLTEQWENLKARAKKENKRVLASPLPLLAMFSEDFNKIINMPIDAFIAHNMQRGGTKEDSENWKQAIDAVISNIDQSKIINTDKYFSDFMEDKYVKPSDKETKLINEDSKYYIEFFSSRFPITEQQAEDFKQGKSVRVSKKSASYFTDNFNLAYNTYALKANIYPVYLNLRNTEEVDANHSKWDNINYKGKKTTTRQLEDRYKESKDGIIIKNVDDTFGDFSEANESTVYIVNNNNDIKSAKNQGGFNRANSNIYYQINRLSEKIQQEKITKVISGGQTGVDTIGLQVAEELGIETGGTAPKNYYRENNDDGVSIKDFGLTEITPEEVYDYESRTGDTKNSFYNARTELNAKNSDGTVYFDKSSNGSAGYASTSRFANNYKKPFIKNPNAKDLAQWIADNNIKTLNIAGNRGSHLTRGQRKEIANIIKEALTNPVAPKDTVVEHFKGKWNRGEVKNDPTRLYIFTDNTERTSGGTLIDADSRYAKKYGRGKYPTKTLAVIRGLDNAMPLSTLRWFRPENSKEGQWKDEDIEEFKKVINAEIEDIKAEWNTGKYSAIVIGSGDGIFNGNISEISIARTPKLYEYLKQKFAEIEALPKMRNTESPMEITRREWEDAALSMKRYIEFIPETHQYKINGILADYSITLWVHRNDDKLKYPNETLEQRKERERIRDLYFSVSSPLGTVHDNLLRDFFEGNIQESYPNLSDSDVLSLINEVTKFKKYLDDRFGEGQYTTITDENSLRVFSLIQTDEGTKLIAGTMDMVVIDKDGKIHIFDFKTKRSNSSENLDSMTIEGYTNLVSLYRLGTEVSYPLFKNKMGSVNLVLFNIKYETPKGASRDGGYFTYKNVNNQLMVSSTTLRMRETPIQEAIVLSTGKRVFEPGKFYKVLDNLPLGKQELLLPVSTIEKTTKMLTLNSTTSLKKMEDFSSKFLTVSQEDSPNELYTGQVTLTFDPNQSYEESKVSGLLNNIPISSFVKIDTVPSKEVFKILGKAKKFYLYPSTTKGNTLNLGKDKELVESAKKAGLQVYENEGEFSVYIPNYTKGLEERELLEMTLRENLLNSGYFNPTELRNLSKMAIFKFSEYVTMLNSDKLANLILLGDRFSNIDFTQMSRIEVILTVGILTLIDIVKQRHFNFKIISLERPIKRSTAKKMGIIHDNFQAFFKLGYDELINMEEISLSESTNIKNDLSDEIDAETELEIQEIYGSSAEHWQVGFRQVSAISSLSKLIKRALSKMYVLDSEGNYIINEFGLAETVDSQEAVSKLLHWTLYANNIEEMIESIKKHLEANPWVASLISELPLVDGDPSSVGKLIGKDNDLFRSLFFSNFKKYFLKYSITYKDSKTGNLLVKMINEKGYSDVLFDLWSGRVSSYSVGNHPLLTDKGKVNKDTLEELKNIYSRNKDTKTATREVAEDLKAAYTLLGLETPEYTEFRLVIEDKKVLETALKKLYYIISNLEKAGNKLYNETILLSENKGGIAKPIKDLIGIVSPIMGESLESVSYEAGKLYYSYVTPSYLNIQIGKLLGHVPDYNAFMNKEFKQYGWFYKKPTGIERRGRYRTFWVEKLANNPESRKVLDHKASLHFLDINYVDKNPATYTASIIKEYLYDDNGKLAWYRIPTMSNKPSEEYIKFYRISNYKQDIIKYLYDVALLEIDRMAAIKQREIAREKAAKEGNDFPSIKNWEKNGKKFVFLDYLNLYLEDQREEIDGEYTLGQLIRNKVEGIINHTSSDDALLLKYLNEAIKIGMEEKFKEFIDSIKENGYLSEDETKVSVGDLLGSTKEETMHKLEDFFYNDTFASINILQIMVTDIAFYKDAEDLQKRLALLHAPGLRANLLAVDTFSDPNSDNPRYYTDGYERTTYIKDSIVLSEVISNLQEVQELFLKTIDNPDSRAYIDTIFKGIISTLRDINYADAQGYSSPTSFRKKRAIFGKWDQSLEDAYQQVLSGNITEENLSILWLPIKPFVYTQIEKNSYSTALGDKMKVAVQNKNSEYTLIIADALLRAGNRPNTLSAIYDVMELSLGLTKNGRTWHGKPNSKGIDTILFESTVKSGLMGIVDITSVGIAKKIFDSKEEIQGKIKEQLRPAETFIENYKKLHRELGNSAEEVAANIILNTWKIKVGEEERNIDSYYQQQVVEEILNDAIYNLDGSYNTDYVHEIPFENYAELQEVPAHFKGALSLGSQVRILPFLDKEDDEIIYINKNRTTVKEARDLYENAVADNVHISLDDLYRKFALLDTNSKIRNILLSRVLQEEILKDGRFGLDILWACSVNKQGEFNVPLSNLIHSDRIQQLLNSVIKNRIDKLEIPGGPLVQVSNFGTSELLLIVFKTIDKNGNETLLPTKEVWEYKKKNTPEDKEVKNFKTYKDFLKGKNASVAYFEAFVPIYDDNLVKDFIRPDGSIDIKAIEEANPKLLEMVGYRIPTESIYSMVPIKIKGFLPRYAGEGIMLPKDITALSGSDFDIDKLYIMRHSFIRTKYIDLNKLAQDYRNYAKEVLIEDITTDKIKSLYKLLSSGMLMDSNEELELLSNWLKMHDNGSSYVKVKYNEPTNLKDINNNIIVDTIYGILTSPSTVLQLFSPGNFEVPKKLGYLISAVLSLLGDSLLLYNKLNEEKTEDLKGRGLKNKNLVYVQNQILFHKQNMTAGKLIGIFALANVSHSFVSMMKGSLLLNSEFSFTLDGHLIEGEISIDTFKDFAGNKISANLAALLAASVDAVKDPILNLMNINSDTANVVVSLLRMGFTLETVALLMTLPVIKKLITSFNIKKNSEKVQLADYVRETILNLLNELGINPDASLNISNTILKASLNGPTNDSTALNVLSIFDKVLSISQAFRDITHMTKYNSITAAVGPFAVDTILMKLQDESFINNDMISLELKSSLINLTMLEAFREDAYKAEEKLIGENFILGSFMMYNALALFEARLGYMTQEKARKFANFFMSYIINSDDSSKIFDTSYERRKYMLSEFPETIIEAKLKYPDNLLLKSIVYRARPNELFKILELKTRGMSSPQVQDIKSSWMQLFTIDPNLALNLIEYNYHRGTLGFNPKTFINIVPAEAIPLIPNYIKNLKKENVYSIYDKQGGDNVLNRIITLFMLNNDITSNRTIKLDEESYVKSKDGWYLTNGKSYNAGFSYVLINGNKVPVIVKPGITSTELVKTHTLGGKGQAIEIDPSVDIPLTVFTEENKKNTVEESLSSSEIPVDLAILLIDKAIHLQDLKSLPSNLLVKDVLYGPIGDKQISRSIISLGGFSILMNKLGEIMKLNKEELLEFLTEVKKTLKDNNNCN